MKTIICRVSRRNDNESDLINVKTGEILIERFDRVQRAISYANGLNTKPFRNCKATVSNSGGVHTLTSYNTLVAAVIDNICFDALRVEYGYTATSAQHIAKFASDYNATVIYRLIP